MVVLPGSSWPGQVLELGDAGVVLVHGVVHRAVALEIVLVQGLEPEVQGAVGQGAEAAAEQLVRRAGVDHRPGNGPPSTVSTSPSSPSRGRASTPSSTVMLGWSSMRLKQGGVALQGHALIGVLEIAVVPGQEDRHPGGGVGVDLLRGLAPLLHGVVDKDVLIDVVGQGGDLRVRILPQLQNGDLLLRAVGGDQLLPQPLPLLRGRRPSPGRSG